ncbi:DUF1444 family protein [Sporolactobacillus putidus]|uniref:UPF0354 protein YtpQ n=1 Tax=Sporolactobacillus putidus TaxID=492735 RepID=A0A917RWG8_9BACL|nr:DUF1444 family protein [Sporolactobacillus putidus]GGL42409.1 UPF0354 protein YtpQ [Sporolactobacillus putidus]
MNQQELRKILTERLASEGRRIRYDHKSAKLRVIDEDSGKGVTLSLADILNRCSEEGLRALEETVYYADCALRDMKRSPNLKGKENKIFPVIRSASFPRATSDGRELVSRAHTAETRIFYAVDLENSYRLLDRQFLRQEGMDEERLFETADFNLRSLPAKPKKDVVQNNAFYFINYNDGYDASRILNSRLLERMKNKAAGDLTVAVPHQDVLIFGDIVNPAGYDILAQMTMKFFASGSVPITILPFIYDNGELEPIFILAGKRHIHGRTTGH